MPTRYHVIAIVVFSLAGAAFASDLAPRRELVKSTRLTPPAYPHQLVVKFRDTLRVRNSAAGLASLAGGDVSDVQALALREHVTFSSLINLPAQKLLDLEHRAAARSGVAQPDLAGMMVVYAPANALQRIANELNASPTTEFVYFQELRPPPPCDDISPTTPSYVGMQDYRGPDPGVNMLAAWEAGCPRGVGIQVADCEFGYVATHEDLCDIIMEPGQTIHPDTVAYGWDEHGTAVFGEMIGLDNEYGCTGLAPDIDTAYFFCEYTVEEGERRVASIANAVATVDPGDVVVLEMQTTGAGGGYAPAEYDPAVWTVVKTATDAGVVVVAAAGNGNQNLDSPAYAEYMDRGDSGSIIVGAGSADVYHNKLGYSTYGSRVDVQGWGELVFTLGYGDYAAHGGDKNQRYTDYFSGTSSATPIVTGCVLALQSLATERLARRLTSQELRQILIDTGIPQGTGGHIGPFPEMLAAMEEIPFAGDLNCDGVVDFFDIDHFVQALMDPVGYQMSHPYCHLEYADMNGDGEVDFFDIDPFVERITE